jgi:hypothetical protein
MRIGTATRNAGLTTRARAWGRISPALLAVIATAVVLAAIEFYALIEHGRPHRTAAPSPAAPAAPAQRAGESAAPAIGWRAGSASDAPVGARRSGF